MLPSTTLAVLQPCHENWAAMTPAAQGRHCAACDKVVLDFTQKTDAEILALLKRTAAPCARFRPDQLGRPLLPPPAPAPRWRTWLAATATVLGLREVAAEQGHGQHPTTVHHDLLTRDERKVAALHERRKPQPDTALHILRGRITDKSSGQSVPGATVLLKNTTIGTSTGIDGSFELILPPSTPADQLVSFSFIGYMTEERQLSSLSAQAGVVQLALDSQVLGLMVTTGHRAPYPWHPRSMWNWARCQFQR